MSDNTTEAVLAALAGVIDPTYGKSLVELGAITDVQVKDEAVAFAVRLNSPSDAVRAHIEDAARAALESAGLGRADIRWDISVPTREVTSEDPIPNVRNVIAVMSGKGGVGKSTVATNLALALSRAGTRVGLLDADMYGPSLPTMLGISGRPHSKDGEKIQPLQRFGIKLMSIGFLVKDPKDAIVWRGPMLNGALKQFIGDVDWGELDYLVIDTPPGTGDVALTLAQSCKATGAVMVTTPQEVALQDVYKCVSMCAKLRIPILGVVENMSFFMDPAGNKHELFGSGGGEKIAEFAEAPLLGQVPLDPRAREWGDKGTPVVQGDPESEVAVALQSVADELSTLIAKQHFERGGGDSAPKTKAKSRLRILR